MLQYLFTEIFEKKTEHTTLKLVTLCTGPFQQTIIHRTFFPLYHDLIISYPSQFLNWSKKKKHMSYLEDLSMLYILFVTYYKL